MPSMLAHPRIECGIKRTSLLPGITHPACQAHPHLHCWQVLAEDGDFEALHALAARFVKRRSGKRAERTAAHPVKAMVSSLCASVCVREGGGGGGQGRGRSARPRTGARRWRVHFRGGDERTAAHLGKAFVNFPMGGMCTLRPKCLLVHDSTPCIKDVRGESLPWFSPEPQGRAGLHLHNGRLGPLLRPPGQGHSAHQGRPVSR